MRRVLPALLLAAACSHELQGPRPEPSSASPALVCAEQLDSPITLSGKGFAPLATKALEDSPLLVLPKVTLVRAKDLGGAAASGAKVIPDDPAKPAESLLKWTSAESMTFRVTPALALEPGLYDIQVDNPSGQTGKAAGALLAVPRPSVTKVVPEAICSDADASLRIEGDFFLKVAGTLPKVTIGDKEFTPTLETCRALPGTGGVEACTQINIAVPKTTLAAATLEVTVTNPAPAACRSTDASVKVLVVPPPTLTSTAPTKVCRGGGKLTLTGTNFRPGSTATLGTLDASAVDVKSATEAAATFGLGLEPPGPYDLTIKTPEQCSATLPNAVTVVDGAQLFFVDPPVFFNGINLQVTAYGSALDSNLKVELVKPDGSPEELEEVPVSASRFLIDLAAGLAVGDYGLRVTDSTGCSATLDKAIKVVADTTMKIASVDPGFGWKNAITGVTVTLESSSPVKFTPVPRLYINPHTPAAGTRARPLEAVDLVSDRSLTTIVPKGLVPGKYDLIIVNPDGAVGVKENAFVVTNEPPPEVRDLSPGSVPRSATQSFVIEGANFRSPTVTLDCLDGSQMLGRQTITPTLAPNPSATRLEVSFDTTVLGTTPTACVVKVTNQEDGTPYVEFSALVVTNPAENLGDPSEGPSLVTPRRALGLAAARVTNAARFLFATGGDAGAEDTAMKSVEGTAINVYGHQGTWATQRHEMTSKRTYHGVASLGRYVYAIAGSDGAQALASVERAAVLDPSFRPDIDDLDLTLAPANTTGLAPGVWYYRVSAVMQADDAFNPDGETLASERFPVSLPTLTPARLFRIKVKFSEVAGARAYRVYRSPTANAPAGQEQLIGEVASTSPRELEDSGLSAQEGTPLPLGSLGKWHTITALTTARRGPAVALVRDLASPSKTFPQVWWLHVIGGAGTGNAVTATAERLRIELAADGTQQVATSWATSTALPNSPRWQARAFVGTDETSKRIADTFPNTKKTIVWVGPGLGNGVAANVVQAAELQADGSLGAWKTVKQTSGAGYGAAFAGNFLYLFAGGSTVDNGSVQGELCAAGVGGCNTTPAPPDIRNWNTATTLSGNRTLSGTLLEGATIYLVGGYDAAGAAATASTEQLVW